MTKVKICGIQTPVEAEYLNRNGADCAGIVLYEKANVTFQSIKQKE